MELEDTRRNWDQFGREDPLWAILGIPSKRNNRWKVDEFFQTGELEIDDLLKQLSDRGIEVPRFRCLDFGCGVGRLTQALCRHFDRCDGVDIAASMIERAREFNRYGDRCSYHLNTANDLKLFGDATFDLIYTRAVLQHMEPRYSLRYISEFVRLLSPEGVAVFESPASYTPLGPLGQGAHKAAIELVSGPPKVMEPGSTANLEVRVTNVADARWPFLGAPTPIQLGNHWLTSGGRTVVAFDDGRAEMPRLLDPGDEAVFNLPVTAPTKRGSYLLELDMVEELVTWFADQGSQTVRTPVRVSGPGRLVTRLKDRVDGRRQAPTGPPDPPPATAESASTALMEMYCLPREDILTVVRDAGGEALHVDEYDAVGDGHTTCSYIVRRASAPPN